jgi:CRISPR-associated endonuclease Csn1
MLSSLDSEKAISLLSEWKSRNLNDTRYITKYLVGYLRRTLMIDSNPKDENRIFAVKGSITAKYRRLWLGGCKWGAEEKDRENTHLHHAVDAVIIANCIPACVEIASDQMKLRRIYNQYGKHESEAYADYLERALQKMKKYYYMPRDIVEPMLRSKDRIPSFLPNLQREVVGRFY